MSLEYMVEKSEKSEGLAAGDVALFVEKALHEVPSTDLRARCIDGRYSEGSAAIAMPGGDAGLLAAGLGAVRRLEEQGIRLPNEAVRDAVLSVVGGKEHFNYHTDDHSEHGAAFQGCGHCRMLSEKPEAYALDVEQANFFAETIETLNKEGIKADVLKGDHTERAVMILKTEGGGEKSWALDGQIDLHGETTQVFVYNATLADQRFTALARELAQSIQSNEEELLNALREVAQAQLQQTAGALAEGLPVYKISVNGETGKIEAVEKA